ncbi:MAG: porin [Sheuella sp.]|nr:porin [Sheuella sp.]
MKRLVLLACVMWSCSRIAYATDVTLYGIIDMGLQYASTQQNVLDDNFKKSFFGIATGVQSGSRFGVRGGESLGSGWRIGFNLEGGFDPGNGTSGQANRLFGRQAILSIMSEQLGQLDFGRQINLASNYFLSIDPFAEGFGQANIGASFGSANTTRYSNMVLYQTPSIEGLKLGAGYSFATGLSSIYADNGSCLNRTCNVTVPDYAYQAQNNLRAITLGAQYAAGPLMLSASLDRLQGPADIPNGPPASSPTAWMVGGSYKFDLFKLSAVYGQTRNGSLNGQSAGTGAGGASGINSSTGSADVLFGENFASDAYLVGLVIPAGARGSVLASWQMVKPAGEYASLGFKNQQIASLGYTYLFTARTNLYAYASYGQNFAMVASAQSSMVGVGIRHQF